MHTFYDAASLQPKYGDPRWVMISFNNDLGPGTMLTHFQVTLGPGSPGAGNIAQIVEMEVVRNLVFLRLNTELTLVPSVEVIVGAGIQDEFGTNFIPDSVTIYGMSVSNPNNGDFGVVPAGSAGRVVAGGFEPGEKVEIDGLNGTDRQNLGELTATENGTISGFFSIPFPAGGPYEMIATGEMGRQVTASFDVIS